MDYENYWEAPAYLWVQKEVTEREMECVMVGDGLSLKKKSKTWKKLTMLAGSRCDSLGVRQILGLDLEMFNRHSNVKTLERKEQRRTVYP